MYRVFSCLTTGHDPWLLTIAICVCVAAATAAFALYAIACQSADSRRLHWAALAGACGGTGIWATHFVAMLAYQAGLPVRYDPLITAESLLIAIGVSAAGFAMAASGRRHARLLGGALVGVAIAAMHFRGMQAVVIPGEFVWDHSLVVGSILAGIGFAAASIAIFHHLQGARAIGFAALCLALGVCALHFIAMGAVVIVPDPTIDAAAGLNKAHLAFAVVSVTLVVILCAVAAIFIQRANLRFEAILRDQNVLFETAIHHLPVGLSMFDADQRLIMCNPAYRKLYGLTEIDTRHGKTFSEIVLQHVEREQGRSEGAIQGAREWIADHLFRLSNGNAFTDILTLPDGRTIQKKVAPIVRGGWVDVQEDVTSTMRANEKLEWLARHDALTGIANRLQFREHLERHFNTYQPSCPFALHWLDLDHFKDINDKLGHQVGDELLKCVAQRLRKSLRAGDVAARLGGDEFAVLQIGVTDESAARNFAERLLANLRAPYDVLGHRLNGSATIGIALAPSHGQTPDLLFASADEALYAAKANGRGIAAIYEAGAGDGAIANPLRRELQQGIENAEFTLHYQPIINLDLGRVSGFEALMRWKHSRRGMIPPSEFIPLAEDSGLIVEMGAWALKQACRDAMTWPNDITVAVNLSALQIEAGDVYKAVCDALSASGLTPARLELEITETVLMRDHERSRKILKKLHALGVRIALDDFGTSFANLSYLHNLPFSTLKIDRSFVHAAENRPESLAILASVADLASKLGMRSIAEGVETAASLAAVRNAGYGEAQGFFFSLPVPARSVSRTLAKCRARLGDINFVGAPRAA